MHIASQIFLAMMMYRLVYRVCIGPHNAPTNDEAVLYPLHAGLCLIELVVRGVPT